MEEGAWTKRVARAMHFSIRRSSIGRGWRGFEVYHYDASDGVSELTFVDHSISMHVGPPVIVSSRCDGAYEHRLQVPGDLKVVPAGYSRIWEIAAPTNKLVVDLAPWFVREVAEGMGMSGNQVSIAPHLHLNDKRMEYIGWALLTELDENDSLGKIYAEGLGTALAAQLLRHSEATSRQPVRGMPKRRLQRVVDYIKENLSRDLSLSELAQVAGVSASHFKLQFRESMGMPVHQFVIDVRIEQALRLLTNTALPLSEVALLAGFASQSHLSRHLQRRHGFSPAVIRREARIDYRR